ncbi:hypothetical protein [Streptomyces monomycini]|uniref:hypothetical protein n=1 Tax=Streptomyces monomycini TaxID=371720 RepID=UPI0004AA0C12|nr:hypothetical protein [Streptomyces monomycini]
MTEFIGTALGDASGPLHSGTGDQYVYFGSSPTGTPRRPPRDAARDELFRLHRRFVFPPGFDQARDRLSEYRTVLISGPVGSGRSAAARELLYERQQGSGSRFVRLPDRVEENDGSGGSILHPDDVQQSDLMLLDLTAAGPDVLEQAQREMSEFRAAVQAKSAWLTVALPSEARVRDDLSGLRVPVGRPEALKVLRRHLHAERIIPEEAEFSRGELTSFLATAHMREVAQFADLVKQYRDQQSPDTGYFKDWLERALAATLRRQTEVREILERSSGAQRALFLSCAMLHGARGQTVQKAAAQLLQAADEPHVVQPLLSRTTLPQRLSDVGAELTAGGRVEFRGLRYDEAVSDCFWDDFPELRPVLRVWTDRLVRDSAAAGEKPDALVLRYARQCLRTESPEELSGTAVAWASASGGTPSWLHRSAYLALDTGLRDETHGGHFREKTYEWATGRQPSPGLVRVLVGVCSGAMAVQHPDSALVRLLHLARRETADTAPIAHDALFDLAFSESRLTRRLLDRIDRAWSRSLSAWRRAREIELFWRLAEPERFADPGGRARPLIAEPVVRRQLTAGWRAVLAARPFADCRARTADWLRTARKWPAARENVLDVLVQACEGRGELLGEIYALDWHLPCAFGEEQAAKADVSALVWRKINAAQHVSS